MSFVKQVSVLDGFASDPFSFQQNRLTAPEVDVGRRQIVDTLVVAQVIMRHVLFVEPCRQLRRDVARAVVGERRSRRNRR